MDAEHSMEVIDRSFDHLDRKFASIQASIRQITWILVAQCLLTLLGIAGMLTAFA